MKKREDKGATLNLPELRPRSRDMWIRVLQVRLQPSEQRALDALYVATRDVEAIKYRDNTETTKPVRNHAEALRWLLRRIDGLIPCLSGGAQAEQNKDARPQR